MSPSFLLTENRDHVLYLTVDRPEKRNALSRAVLEQLKETFDSFKKDEELKLVVLTGGRSETFASGGDLIQLSEIKTEQQAEDMAVHARSALDAVRRFPVPVIAALNGDALGGGGELAMACDFRAAAAHARLGFVQGRHNISSAWGGGVDLISLLGWSKALRLMCGCEMIGGEEALRLGVFDIVAAPDQPLEQAVAGFVAPFLRQKPQVLRAFKALAMAARFNAGRAEMEAIELKHFVANWVHDDHWEALEAFVSAHRK